MADGTERPAVRHLLIGVTARGATMVRITLAPMRPMVRGATALGAAPPLAPLRRLATARAEALARSGAEVERQLVEAGDRLVWQVAHSRRLDALADRVAASDRAAELAAHALGGPLTDRIAGVVVEHALLSAEIEALISRTLERPELERLIVLALDSPATDRIVKRVLAAPGVELAVTRVLESELLDTATARFVESDEIERVIERIAHGPELRAAVAAQSAGLVDLVAEEVRGRSASADDVAERLARALVPRRWRHGPSTGPAGT